MFIQYIRFSYINTIHKILDLLRIFVDGEKNKNLNVLW